MKWTAGRAVIEDVVCRADDEDVLRVVERASKTGIDCPFGWPAAFVGFVSAHHASQPVPAGGPGSRRNLTMRRTDLFVHEQLGLTPLSVSADRIAHVALRCRYGGLPGTVPDRVICMLLRASSWCSMPCMHHLPGTARGVCRAWRAACLLNASR
jgi:hypothetical protein